MDIHIRQMSERAILLDWPARIDEAILDEIISATQWIEQEMIDQIEDYTPAYSSLLLVYKKELNFQKEKKALQRLLHSLKYTKIVHEFNEWHIPVCYDQEYGWDLDAFATNITREEVVALHTQPKYRVFMIGFLPGFLYLGGLPESLAMPRRNTPRRAVPKGAIAIGGNQTGIYPMESPGGWHIIGRTPLQLFDIHKDDPTSIRQGDYIIFYPIHKETYTALSESP